MTKSEWKDRIRPHLHRSMQDVSEVITSAPDVQSWLHEASYEAAEGLAEMHPMQAEATGHMRMLDDLQNAFPALVNAVDELTSGYGSLDIHWRPLTPNFSRVTLSFEREYSVKAFIPLNEASASSGQRAVDHLRDTLPKGDPFPNRPHEVTALLVHRDIPLGLRLHDRLTDDGRVVSATLLPEGARPVEQLPLHIAPRAIADFYTAELQS